MSATITQGTTASSERDELRELDHRSGDGLDVALYWRPADNRTLVTVWDAKAGDAFTIVVAEDERPLDVFRHPYAYARPPRQPR